MALVSYASPMEEQMIEKAIKDSIPWEQLPKRVKLFVGSNESYIKAIRLFCMNARMRWEVSPAINFCKEADYYDDMVKHLRTAQSPFPYHVADYVCRVMRVSPFKYYCDLLLDVMKQEKSYDTIPNFTAADALRETGIGRNQFIEIMNKSRAKLLWRLNRGIVKDMFPTEPVGFPLEPWWLLCVANLSSDEYRRLSEEELEIVERGGQHGDAMVGEYDEDVVRCLYAKGIVYFDVPVYPNDRFRVSSLEGFVSNRNQQQEDATEKLLYALLVTSSEQATVEEMASTLQAEVSQLGAAISLACRLGWAEKVLDVENLLDQMSLNSDAALGGNSTLSTSALSMFDSPAASASDPSRMMDRMLRVALMVDANLTSFLMMGSFSYELKQHAVTLYEAGKLGERSVAELCGELRAVENTRLEGELQKFTEHAFSLRCALSCLRTSTFSAIRHSIPSAVSHSSTARVTSSPNKGEKGRGTGDEGGTSESRVGMVAASRSEDERGRAEGSEGTRREGDGMEAALARDAAAKERSSGDEVEKRSEPDNSQKAGTGIPDVVGEERSEGQGRWEIEGGMDRGMPGCEGGDVDQVEEKASKVGVQESEVIAENERNDEEAHNSGLQTAVSGAPSVAGTYNRVEMLRCESLAGLSPATLQRLLQRDFNVIVSIIPLPKPLPIVAAHGPGPVHFGPPAPAFLSPWSKLLLYSLCCAGPVSMALMRAQRFRHLPPPLSGCTKALVWSWDGVPVGGAGGKIEGTLVDGGILLHVLNSLLKHCAVLVQPLSAGSSSLSPRTREPVIECVPLPLKDSGLRLWAGAEDRLPTAQASCVPRVASDSILKTDPVASLPSSGAGGGEHGPTGQIERQNEGQSDRQSEGQTEGASRKLQVRTLSVEVTEPGSIPAIASGAVPGEADGSTNPAAFEKAKTTPPSSLPSSQTSWDTVDGAAQSVVTKLGLNAVGFLRMMRVDKEGRTRKKKKGRGSSETSHWVPHSVEFGIPMFDADLCTQVCERIVSESVLSEEGLESHQAAAQVLRTSLRDFIADYMEKGPVERAVHRRDASLLRSTSRRWSPNEDRPTYEVVTPRVTVEPSVFPGHGHKPGRQRTSAFLSRRLSSKHTEFWFLSDSLTPNQGGKMNRGVSEEMELNLESSEEELLNSVMSPGVNLLFDGRLLLPVDVTAFLQGRPPSLLLSL